MVTEIEKCNPCKERDVSTVCVDVFSCIFQQPVKTLHDLKDVSSRLICVDTEIYTTLCFMCYRTLRFTDMCFVSFTHTDMSCNLLHIDLWDFLCRRTNSDSALHQSTLSPAQQPSFTGGSQELQPKRGACYLKGFNNKVTTQKEKVIEQNKRHK